MEADELFRILRPVLGERLDALWLEYHLSPGSKKEIEGLLRLLAAQHLGKGIDRGKILLPPPTKESAAGDYPLGQVVYGDRELHPFGLRESEWIQHLGIFGRTGSGKTNVGFLIIKRLIDHQKPFLIFDWKRNYRDIIAWPEAQDVRVFTVGRSVAPFGFNPLAPPHGTPPSTWLKKLIEILMHVYWLGEGVAYLLQKAIDAVYVSAGVYDGAVTYPTLADVLAWLQSYHAKGREAQWLDSTMRVLGTLCYGDISNVVNTTTPTPLDEVLRQRVVVELDALTNSDKTFLIETLLLWIHHFRLQEPAREQFKHAIIIEEAHHILLRRKESKESIPDIILREIRELGEGIVIIDQHPSLISIPSLGNTFCTIGMNLKHARDVATIGEAMLIDHKDREAYGRLEVGTGIVKLQGRHFSPFQVRFPLVGVRKGSVTDSTLRERFAGYSGLTEVIPPPDEPKSDIQVIRAAGKNGSEEELGEDERRMLEDVMLHVARGLAARFRSLSFSPVLGERVTDRLERRHLISSADVSTGNGRVRVLQLTEKGVATLRALGHDVPTMRRGGPSHEYWRHRLADALRSHGFRVQLEYPVGAGAIDIVAEGEKGRIAIEVETGNSDVVANAEKCRRVGFDTVIVFDVTGRAKRDLASAGLSHVVEILTPATWHRSALLGSTRSGTAADV